MSFELVRAVASRTSSKRPCVCVSVPVCHTVQRDFFYRLQQYLILGQGHRNIGFIFSTCFFYSNSTYK